MIGVEGAKTPAGTADVFCTESVSGRCTEHETPTPELGEDVEARAVPAESEAPGTEINRLDLAETKLKKL